jgi:hypothetical protein
LTKAFKDKVDVRSPFETTFASSGLRQIVVGDEEQTASPVRMLTLNVIECGRGAVSSRREVIRRLPAAIV